MRIGRKVFIMLLTFSVCLLGTPSYATMNIWPEKKNSYHWMRNILQSVKSNQDIKYLSLGI